MQKTVQVVIEIPEDEYKYIKEYGLFGYGVPSTKCPVEDAIKNGTVLPKHGRLIDEDELPLDIDYSDIENAPTILEANKAESEKQTE